MVGSPHIHTLKTSRTEFRRIAFRRINNHNRDFSLAQCNFAYNFFWQILIRVGLFGGGAADWSTELALRNKGHVLPRKRKPGGPFEKYSILLSRVVRIELLGLNNRICEEHHPYTPRQLFQGTWSPHSKMGRNRLHTNQYRSFLTHHLSVYRLDCLNNDATNE